METKQVIVIRKDLNMRKGKMCAQAAHASMKVILDMMEKTDDDGVITYSLTNMYYGQPLYHWISNLFTKVVVACDSEEELFELKKKADDLNIINAIIQDSGKTEFDGEPTYTALAIGPDEIEKINLITGHLKLL